MSLVRKSPGQNMLGLPGNAVEMGCMSLGSCPEEEGHTAKAPWDSRDCQTVKWLNTAGMEDPAPYAHHSPCGVHSPFAD